MVKPHLGWSLEFLGMYVKVVLSIFGLTSKVICQERFTIDSGSDS